MIIIIWWSHSIFYHLFQVQPKAQLLQILRVAGAKEEVFTLKEVSCLG